MLAYQLRLAWKSLRRNPILSTLIAAGIALGIGVSSTFVTIHSIRAGDPIPHKSDRLFWVRLDAWDPTRAFNPDEPEEPPDQLTYRDAQALRESTIPTLQTPMYKILVIVHPEGKDERPMRVLARLCSTDFFELFDVPFRYGAAWDHEADSGPEQVVVLDRDTNDKLFGGEDSVGRRVRIEDREFTVTGVLDEWRPIPKFYDPLNDPFEAPEGLYLPFDLGRELEIFSAGNTSGWKPNDGDGFEGFLESESTWVQYWVQLDDERQREAYQSWLDAYALGQKELGRFQRPLNNELTGVREWLVAQEVVSERDRSFALIALLFLLVCSVNLIGILLGKFLARAPEIGVRRALGASRRWVFVQHLVECELIGIIGGVVGLGLAAIGLRLIKRVFQNDLVYRLDPTMVVVALALALGSATIAGLYPAWRICRTEPGLHLKLQ
jgi:putative ABC transport system permease protein